MTRRTPTPPPLAPNASPYAGPPTRATVALDPHDQRVAPWREQRLPPREEIDPWAEWQRHLDAGRIGEGAGKAD